MFGCLCPDGQRRTEDTGALNCLKCSDGMDCAWSNVLFKTSSYFEKSMTSQSTLTERIYLMTQNQTRPFVLPGFWASEANPTEVFQCGAGLKYSADSSPCVGTAATFHNSAGINLCKGRRQGALCAECPTGERPEGNGTCSACDTGLDALIVTLMVVL
eukprot:6635915-Prymnesium_polylepis.1